MKLIGKIIIMILVGTFWLDSSIAATDQVFPETLPQCDGPGWYAFTFPLTISGIKKDL